MPSNALHPSLPPPIERNEMRQEGRNSPPLQGTQQAPQAPVLSHQEAVAALRHFHAIQDELETLLKNPQLGKADIKPSIIEGTTALVAKRIMSAPSAVMQLSTVPERPQDQRQWVMKHYQDAMLAQAVVLDHHRAGPPGTQDWATEAQQQGNPDQHIDTMNGVFARYKGGNNA